MYLHLRQIFAQNSQWRWMPLSPCSYNEFCSLCNLSIGRHFTALFSSTIPLYRLENFFQRLLCLSRSHRFFIFNPMNDSAVVSTRFLNGTNAFYSIRPTHLLRWKSSRSNTSYPFWRIALLPPSYQYRERKVLLTQVIFNLSRTWQIRFTTDQPGISPNPTPTDWCSAWQIC